MIDWILFSLHQFPCRPSAYSKTLHLNQNLRKYSNLPHATRDQDPSAFRYQATHSAFRLWLGGLHNDMKNIILFYKE